MKVMYILLQIYTMNLLNICVYYLIERKIEYLEVFTKKTQMKNIHVDARIENPTLLF